MTEIDLAFEEPEPEKSLLDEVNKFLKSNDHDGQDFTVQDIAERLGVGIEQLTLWMANDEDFKAGLERYKRLQENGIFESDEFDNRADAMVIAMLILETKNKQ